MKKALLSPLRPFTFTLIALIFTLATTASAQYTETTLYTFPYNGALASPSGVVMDKAGSLYGTTSTEGCSSLCGTVFELSPSSGGWIETTLYTDTVGNLGAPLVIDAKGNLFGVAYGNSSNCGEVFEGSPTSTGWIFTTLVPFYGVIGCHPATALTLGPDGVVYGTTAGGGVGNFGTIFKLTPTSSGWQHQILHYFAGGTGGEDPQSPVALDSAGNIFGTGLSGGMNNYGIVFRLKPQPNGKYTFTPIHYFSLLARGAHPAGSLVLDTSGNIFGTTTGGGTTGEGIAYELVKGPSGYAEKVVHTFSTAKDGENPTGGLIVDSTGNLYGSTSSGINGIYGTVFKLSPSSAGWFETILLTGSRDFDAFNQPLLLDSAGNLYTAANNNEIFALSPPAP